MVKKVAILLAGRAGVGKSTTAEALKTVLEEKGISVSIEAYASGIKEIARLMGWNGEKDDAGRQLLIDIGNAGRAYNIDTWANYLNKIIDQSDVNFVLIDDWRFPREGQVIINNESLSTLRIRIDAPERESLKGKDNYNDKTECSLPDAYAEDAQSYYDVVIENHDDFDQLTAVCRDWLENQPNLLSL